MKIRIRRIYIYSPEIEIAGNGKRRREKGNHLFSSRFVDNRSRQRERERECGKRMYERDSAFRYFSSSARNRRRSRDARPWFGEIKRGGEETDRLRRGKTVKEATWWCTVRKLSEILYYYGAPRLWKRKSCRVVGFFRFIRQAPSRIDIFTRSIGDLCVKYLFYFITSIERLINICTS